MGQHGSERRPLVVTKRRVSLTSTSTERGARGAETTATAPSAACVLVAKGPARPEKKLDLLNKMEAISSSKLYTG